MDAHDQPAQGGAVEQVKRQRGALEPKDPRRDPGHQPAGSMEHWRTAREGSGVPCGAHRW